jgi:hypothetical protein
VQANDRAEVSIGRSSFTATHRVVPVEEAMAHVLLVAADDSVLITPLLGDAGGCHTVSHPREMAPTDATLTM